MKELTGKHVFWIFFIAFLVVLSVNFTMAFLAFRTFPGLEAKNSYDASQGFNARLSAQQSLGWESFVSYSPDQLEIKIKDREGTPVTVEVMEVQIGRPSTARDDLFFVPRFTGSAYVIDHPLPAGQWRIYIRALSKDQIPYEVTANLRVAQ